MHICVIVPVYNVEKYLSQCLDSLVTQTWHDYEVIMVNDGSTDSSRTICQSYLDNPCFCLIDQENGGLSAARNTGMTHAQGDAVCFVDSDDVVAPEFLEILATCYMKYPDALPIVSYQTFHTSNPYRWDNKQSYKTTLLSPRQALKALYSKETLGFFTVAVTKLYPRYLWQYLSFPVGKLHEDVAISLDILLHVDQVAYCHAPAYFYRRNPQSIMTTPSPRHLDAVDFYHEHVHTLLNTDYAQCACDAQLALMKTIWSYSGKLLPSYKSYERPVQERIDQSLILLRHTARTLPVTKQSVKDIPFIIGSRYMPRLTCHIYRLSENLLHWLRKD